MKRENETNELQSTNTVSITSQGNLNVTKADESEVTQAQAQSNRIVVSSEKGAEAHREQICGHGKTKLTGSYVQRSHQSTRGSPGVLGEFHLGKAKREVTGSSRLSGIVHGISQCKVKERMKGSPGISFHEGSPGVI